MYFYNKKGFLKIRPFGVNCLCFSDEDCVSIWCIPIILILTPAKDYELLKGKECLNTLFIQGPGPVTGRNWGFTTYLLNWVL